MVNIKAIKELRDSSANTTSSLRIQFNDNGLAIGFVIDDKYYVSSMKTDLSLSELVPLLGTTKKTDASKTFDLSSLKHALMNNLGKLVYNFNKKCFVKTKTNKWGKWIFDTDENGNEVPINVNMIRAPKNFSDIIQVTEDELKEIYIPQPKPITPTKKLGIFSKKPKTV